MSTVERHSSGKPLVRCCECGSLFFKGLSRMSELCPECAHRLYGYDNCSHVMSEGRCVKCYWDGSISDFLKRREGVDE
jgi:hypothetical protein